MKAQIEKELERLGNLASQLNTQPGFEVIQSNLGGILNFNLKEKGSFVLSKVLIVDSDLKELIALNNSLEGFIVSDTSPSVTQGRDFLGRAA